jgi:hypothetical protein
MFHVYAIEMGIENSALEHCMEEAKGRVREGEFYVLVLLPD